MFAELPLNLWDVFETVYMHAALFNDKQNNR